MPWTNPSTQLASLIARQGLMNSWEFMRAFPGKQEWWKKVIHSESSFMSENGEMQSLSWATHEVTTGQYFLCWYCFNFCLQSDAGTAWTHVMNERMIAIFPDQQQCTSHFRHNYAVVLKKKKKRGYCLKDHFLIHSSDSVFCNDSTFQLWDFKCPV